MQIKLDHPGIIMPTKGSEFSGAWDIYMPEHGFANGEGKLIGLGFRTAIPSGFVALMFPRSGVGAQFGLELNNTCGVIDADYRGEWKASVRTKSGEVFYWQRGERLLQFVVVPVYQDKLVKVPPGMELPASQRGAGGFGSTGAS